MIIYLLLSTTMRVITSVKECMRALILYRVYKPKIFFTLSYAYNAYVSINHKSTFSGKISVNYIEL